ncbi:endonuclease/exonuclease/phosphatase family protein [Shimia aestuarii]|uniref:Metal-dependent hydrolase, endonuclease/exonuclease/phosphatase family n=1 Tax=Shimia aestuarii TaxID=254406 RepID=A0A1I4P7S6_9RHOB|nr:endonuclease/exonuclease/phosphatase family protein [Shimia aestuarii]SFM23858.1 Metal-dependent hydrolase, endonuclease/exonuclease/phosphatase family [Shimia aestuarii]
MTSLRLASYNLQKCVGLDMQRRPDRSLLVIRALRADVVVLQEADKRLPPRPTALPFDLIETHGFDIVDFGQPGGSLGWHGNAMLVRNGATIIETDALDLPGLEPRGAIRADLDTSIGPLRVIGVHLGLLRRYRLMQLSAITRHLRRLAPMPTILAGDFNEWGSKRALDVATPGLDFVEPGHSFPAARPIAGLDGFALDKTLTPVNKAVHSRRPARVASDHLPVWIEVKRA